MMRHQKDKKKKEEMLSMCVCVVCVGASSLLQYPVGLLYLLGGWRGSEIMERWSVDGPGST